MKKLNLKYFTGSFFLSLVAVFIATKAYFVMSWSTQQNEPDINSVEAKNIELFAANEENDPIYEKYKKLAAADAPLGTDSVTETVTTAKTAETPASEEIVYAANDSDDWIKEDENFVTQPQEDILSTDDLTPANPVITATTEDTAEELQIADASTAPSFAIPLKHNYNIEAGTVSVFDEADGSQIALASKNVSVYNLGTDNAAAVTEPLETEDSVEDETSSSANEDYTQNDEDDAWSVAETANKHVTKNTFGVKSEPVQQNVALPDAEAPQDKQVAYKLQPNILIPIPEDILNDENLTPQFSTSQENLKLEQELRDTHQLPELKPEERISDQDDSSINKPTDPNAIPSIDDEKDFDSDDEDTDANEEEDAEESQKLSDSVAAWFDGIKSKVTGNKKSSPNAKKGKNNQRSSIFQRLLGKDDAENIVPTELKLSFQPNRAEISGQTLEWLHAFAENAVNEENVVVEIRVDRSASFEVQQKRLKLLYKILADNGVEQRKVNILFTDREPNSFIIRNVRYATDEQRIEATKRADNPWN